MTNQLKLFFLLVCATVFSDAMAGVDSGHINDSLYFKEYDAKARRITMLRELHVTTTDTLLKPDSSQFYNTDLRYVAFADYAIYYRSFKLTGDTLYPPIPSQFYNTDLLYIAQANYAIYLRTFAGGGGGGGGGTVTNVGVATANGLAGTVANSTTTPVITLSTTITGLLKGNGTAISAAIPGTDYATGSGTKNTLSIWTGSDTLGNSWFSQKTDGLGNDTTFYGDATHTDPTLAPYHKNRNVSVYFKPQVGSFYAADGTIRAIFNRLTCALFDGSAEASVDAYNRTLNVTGGGTALSWSTTGINVNGIGAFTGALTSGTSLGSSNGGLIMYDMADNFYQGIANNGSAGNIVYYLPTTLPTSTNNIMQASVPVGGVSQLSFITSSTGVSDSNAKRYYFPIFNYNATKLISSKSFSDSTAHTASFTSPVDESEFDLYDAFKILAAPKMYRSYLLVGNNGESIYAQDSKSGKGRLIFQAGNVGLVGDSLVLDTDNTIKLKNFKLPHMTSGDSTVVYNYTTGQLGLAPVSSATSSLSLVGTNSALNIPFVKTASSALRSLSTFAFDSIRNILLVGSPTIEHTSVAQFQSSVNTYNQLTIRNSNNGTLANSGFTLENDGDTTHFANWFFNSIGNTDPSFTAVWKEGSAIYNAKASMWMGTMGADTTGFFAGGSAKTNRVGYFTPSIFTLLVPTITGTNSVTSNSVILGSSANTIAGGATSGGNLVLTSSTNATKGNIEFGGSTGFNYSEVNKNLGIGIAPSAGYGLEVTGGNSGGYNISITNTNSSSTAACQAINNAGEVSQVTVTGNGYVTAGLSVANQGNLFTTGTAGLLICNGATGASGAPTLITIGGFLAVNQYCYTNYLYQTVFGENTANRPSPQGSSSLQFVDGQSYTNNLVDGTYPNFQHFAQVGTPASTSQTTLYSDSITANTFSRNGAILHIVQTGYLTKAGTLRYYFGTTGTSSDSLEISTGALTTTNGNYRTEITLQRVSNGVLNITYTFAYSNNPSSKVIGNGITAPSAATYTIGSGTALTLGTTKYYLTTTGASTAGLTANDITANTEYAEYITPK